MNDEIDYKERKAVRQIAIAIKVLDGPLYENKCKKKICSACSGSGYYDHNGSPKCRTCGGSGRT